jgi:hypothetical protein
MTFRRRADMHWKELTLMLKLLGAALIAAGLAAGSAQAASVSQTFGLLTSCDAGPSLSATLSGLPTGTTGDLTISFAIGGDFDAKI